MKIDKIKNKFTRLKKFTESINGSVYDYDPVNDDYPHFVKGSYDLYSESLLRKNDHFIDRELIEKPRQVRDLYKQIHAKIEDLMR